MTNTELRNVLKKHQLWLDGKLGGERATFIETDLAGANLAGANLERANLFKANLSKADLQAAILVGANLEEANLEDAILVGTNFRDTNLTGANLEEANLCGANLIKTKGLLNPMDYLAQTFEKTADGYIVYKVFGMYYPPRTDWIIKNGSIIEDIVNLDRRTTCGYGINVATKKWIKRENPRTNKVWKCLIKWEWLPGVVVPYATNGKIRCERLMLLEEVDI